MADIIEAEWMGDESRHPWVRNSLVHRIAELRSAAAKCRRAFTKPYMGEPSCWLADAYDEAAEVLEARLAMLAALNTANEREGT